MEFDSPNDGAPLPELIDPIVQGGLGHNDHVWAMNATVLLQVAQQRDRLQGLAQPLQQINFRLNHQLLLFSTCSKNSQRTGLPIDK